MLPTWLYSYKDYSCRGNLDDSLFYGETLSKSMLLLMRRHLVFRCFFYDKIGECSLRGCILIKITHVGGTLMILIFDGETSSKSMLLLMRRHLVFRLFFFTIK